jgi:hypothetical protein
MKSPLRILWVALLVGLTGCSNMDRIGTKMDMEVQRFGSDKPLYEGHVRSVASVGAMTSIQFTDGKIFEVRQAPEKLVPDDLVRIYEGEDGYVAHLWRSAESDLPSAETNTLAPAVPSAK